MAFHSLRWMTVNNLKTYQIEEVLVVADDGAVRTCGDLIMGRAAAHGAGRSAEVKNWGETWGKNDRDHGNNLRHLLTGFPFCFMTKM